MKVVKLFSLSKCIGVVAKFLIKIGLREDAKVGLSEWTLVGGGIPKGLNSEIDFLIALWHWYSPEF